MKINLPCAIYISKELNKMEHIGLFLKKIYFEKRSGTLFFKREGLQKQLFFQDGDLIFAKTNQPEEMLGNVLYRLGKISKEVYTDIESYIEPRQNLGAILIKRGLISERNLNEGLMSQMREITLNLFSLLDAEISFQEKKSFMGEDIEIKVSTPYLIEDGIRRMPFHPRLKTFLENKVPAPKGEAFIRVLTAEEKRLLGQVSGESSSASLFPSSGLPAEIFWKSLYLFYCLDLIVFAEDQEVRREDKKEETPAMSIEQQIEEIIELREKLPLMSFYEILNVSRDSSEEQIKKAYFQLARKFHPDRFDRETLQKYKGQIEEIFGHVTKAYKVLSDRERRKAYDKKALAPGEGRDQTRTAEIKFRQAKTLYNQGRFEDALVLLEETLRLSKGKGDYYLLLAMTESKIPFFRKKAEKDFLNAVEMEPWNPEGFVGLGLLYKQEGLFTKASKQFKKALEIDSDHSAARKELDEIEKLTKRKGLKDIFSISLFGKKK